MNATFDSQPPRRRPMTRRKHAPCTQSVSLASYGYFRDLGAWLDDVIPRRRRCFRRKQAEAVCSNKQATQGNSCLLTPSRSHSHITLPTDLICADWGACDSEHHHHSRHLDHHSLTHHGFTPSAPAVSEALVAGTDTGSGAVAGTIIASTNALSHVRRLPDPLP